MCKFNPSNEGRRMDKCMENLICNLNMSLKDGLKTVACCCGHGKYSMSILIQDKYGNVWDMCSNNILNRKTRFYRRDEEGVYYIPENLKTNGGKQNGKNK
jgi:hypothetical protein